MFQFAGGLSPFVHGGKVGCAREMEAFAKETGLTVTFDLPGLRQGLFGGSQRARDAGGTLAKKDSEADAKVRAVIVDLLKREFEVPEEYAAIVLTLEAVLHAPLVHIVLKGGPSMKFMASLGKGRVVRCSVMKSRPKSQARYASWAAATTSSTAATWR